MPDPATPQGTSKGAEGARPLQAHLSAIWEGLSPAEREQAQRFLEGLTTDQQAAWLIELGRLPVPQAITWVRAILEANHASQPTTEGASPNAAAPAPPGVNDPR
jgi:DNA-binding CsgD family transcriptional regulator